MQIALTHNAVASESHPLMAGNHGDAKTAGQGVAPAPGMRKSGGCQGHRSSCQGNRQGMAEIVPACHGKPEVHRVRHGKTSKETQGRITKPAFGLGACRQPIQLVNPEQGQERSERSDYCRSGRKKSSRKDDRAGAQGSGTDRIKAGHSLAAGRALILAERKHGAGQQEDCRSWPDHRRNRAAVKQANAIAPVHGGRKHQRSNEQ